MFFDVQLSRTCSDVKALIALTLIDLIPKSLTHHFTAYCSHRFATLSPECCCARSISLFNFDSKVLLATLPYHPLGSSDFPLPYPYSIIPDLTARTAHKLAVHGTDDVRRMHARDLISIPSRPFVALPLSHHIALPLSHHIALPLSHHIALPLSHHIALPLSQLYAIPLSHLYALPLSHLYAIPLSHLYALPLPHLYAFPLSHLYALPLSHLVALPFLVPSPSASLTLSPRPRPPFPPVALPFSSPSVQIAFAICSPIPLLSCFPSPSIQIVFAICSPIPSPSRFPSPPRSHFPAPHNLCPPFLPSPSRSPSGKEGFPSPRRRHYLPSRGPTFSPIPLSPALPCPSTSSPAHRSSLSHHPLSLHSHHLALHHFPPFPVIVVSRTPSPRQHIARCEFGEVWALACVCGSHQVCLVGI
ncbi:unnamed protein product [Closterium sp. Yama58-4]|nr:unnamed protein product [Closterium sp. Yama58-4]